MLFGLVFVQSDWVQEVLVRILHSVCCCLQLVKCFVSSFVFLSHCHLQLERGTFGVFYCCCPAHLVVETVDSCWLEVEDFLHCGFLFEFCPRGIIWNYQWWYLVPGSIIIFSLVSYYEIPGNHSYLCHELLWTPQSQFSHKKNSRNVDISCTLLRVCDGLLQVQFCQNLSLTDFLHSLL